MSDISRVDWASAEGSCTIYAVLIPEEEGGYSIVSENIPGCVSQGETIEECLENLDDAAVSLLEAYRHRGEEIPFVKDFTPQPGMYCVTVKIG